MGLALVHFQKYWLLRRQPGFNPITFIFSENSNYWRETLLEGIRQKIAGWCQQTFCYQNFVDNTQQAFPLIIWIFTEDEGDGIESRLHFKNFSSLHTMWWNPFWRSIYFLKNLCFTRFLLQVDDIEKGVFSTFYCEMWHLVILHTRKYCLVEFLFQILRYNCKQKKLSTNNHWPVC